MPKTKQTKSKSENKPQRPPTAGKLLLTGKEIVDFGEEAELLVGGKNYNTALISQIKGIRTPQFRAISSTAFHTLLDQSLVDGSLIQKTVEKEYEQINWRGTEINADPDFLKHFVRNLGRSLLEKQRTDSTGSRISLREFINQTVSGFADSQEDIDQLRKRSVLVQTAIMSVPLPGEVHKVVTEAYRSICREAGMDQVQVAVRSSAAGEDSKKKAFAGLQDTYLNITSEEDCALAYQWDCSSAYNLRSMTYRRESIRDTLLQAEQTKDPDLAEEAKQEWSIENTSLSVCIMRMIEPVISGTAFSADTATGCRGTDKNDLVSIDASYGLGEAVVSGLVTPDKCYVFQREDGQEVVIRQMGVKDKEIVYDQERGGTRVISVPEGKQHRWSLSMAQAEEVARGVRAISRAYSGMIMDTEFCIDQWGDLWFVQARPETRWNTDFEKHPQTIFMRRQELDPEHMDTAEVILEGNGASRGAGSGKVKFLRSALELNKVNKGDILAADRTDPDMVPGMRVASAILASAGGDTSHAAITSRELGVPSVIGINKTEVLRALDGQEVTVDGSSGKVYRGIRPLIDVGGEIDVGKLPPTKTKVGLILADVGQAMFLSRLRQSPDFEIGLLRAEFMLGNIGVHPLALNAYDQGTLSRAINEKLEELENELTKKIREQLASGILTFDLNLRKYVGIISGLDSEIEHLQEEARVREKKEALSLKKRIRELERRLDQLLEKATQRLDVLKTSIDLGEHIAQVMGFKDLLVQLNDLDPEEKQKRHEIEDQIAILKERAIDQPEVRQVLERIRKLRHEVSQKIGLNQTMDEVRQIPEKIKNIIKQKGYRSGRELYIQTLAQGLALFAMAFSSREVIYRTTDFKSNEYRNLVGGMLYEIHEDNPMIGYRGVSRNLHDWEIKAFKLARNSLGGKNLNLMLPFVRSLEEARSMKRYLLEVHNLKSGEDGLKIIQMSEIPSNAILAKEFIQDFDGFSIGSNDMTQLVLGTDRDNPRLQKVYDEEDPAVVWAILVTIFTGQRLGKKVGFCGQGVSNSTIIRGLVCIAGIVSASVVPDTYAQTKQDIHELELENIPVSELGSWIKEQHLKRLIANLEQDRYGHILKHGSSPETLNEWYTGELGRLHLKLKDSQGSPREEFYRQELETFRTRFHKSMIYANWDWETTIRDALHQAGFSSFAEQHEALKRQRELIAAETVSN